MTKKEIATTGTEKATPAVKMITADDFKASLQGALGLSPLATGVKFESDDLVGAVSVQLRAFDWVDYIEGEGTANEKQVHFALWAVTLEDGDGNVIEGYYQGGTVLNKLARHIESTNLYDALEEYGVFIKAEWGQTSSKNKILLITVV